MSDRPAATVFMKLTRAMMSIRTAISIACLAVLASCGGEPTAAVTSPTQPEMPITGAQVPGMKSYDQVIPDFMRKFGIPGGAVAVMRDGKLIYARGFGYADVENKVPVQPDALFRIASVSKTLTSAAIMTLVEEGKLGLDDRVAPFIAYLTPAPGATSIRGGSRSPLGTCSTTPEAGIATSRMVDSTRSIGRRSPRQRSTRPRRRPPKR